MKTVTCIKYSFITLFLFAFILTEAACAAQGQPEPDTDIQDNHVQEVQYPVTVTDQAGRDVTIAEQPERIISGYYISTTTIISLGAADRLVGIEAGADKRPIYKLAVPELLQLPNVGTAREFNLEACLALEPDLVVLPIRLRDIADVLGDMDVAVLLVNPESVSDILEMFSLLGKATGETERADFLTAYWEVNLLETENLAQTVTSKETVYMTGTGTYLSTSPEGMFQSSLITLTGAVNAAGGLDGDSRQEVSYEQLLVMNPQVIIVPPEASFRTDDIMSDPQLSGIDAVLNGRVYQMPDAFEAWDSPIPSALLGIKWLQHTLYGDSLYPIEELRNAVFDFYNEFYNIQVDTELIN